MAGALPLTLIPKSFSGISTRSGQSRRLPRKSECEIKFSAATSRPVLRRRSGTGVRFTEYDDLGLTQRG